jgi:hypothetical protein
VLRDRQAKTKPDGGIFSGGLAHFLERHRHHKDTRNKHIAHSPNASDVTSSAAWIRGVCSDEPGTRRVGAIHAFRSSDATPVSTTTNIHPTPQHLVTITMLEAGPLAILEVAGSDLSMMLDANFGELPFHALR